MPIFLSQASYTQSGVQGLIKDGGTKRRTVVTKMVEQLGGKELAFYYAYGESDVYLITEFPDRNTALAVSIAVNASGATRLQQTELITPEEVDAAISKLPKYAPPGA